MRLSVMKRQKTKLTAQQDQHYLQITTATTITTTVMTTERRAMAQRNKRRQEIKERRLTLDVKWQAQSKTGGMTSLEVGNERRVTGVGEGWDCGRRGLGYLSIVCTPCRRRVFNSTPRAGLGFLRDSNIQQLSVSEGAFKCLYSNEWRSLIEDLFYPLLFLMPAPLTAFSVKITLFPTGHVYLDHQSVALFPLKTATERECAESRCQRRRFWMRGAYLISIPWLGSSSSWILPPSGVRRYANSSSMSISDKSEWAYGK